MVEEQIRGISLSDQGILPHKGWKPYDVEAPVLTDDDVVLEANEQFCLDGFQVVRREFFAHLHEPSITFNNNKMYVNSACLQKFPGVEYVQTLVNEETKTLALLPCREDTRDSFMWCSTSKGKRKVKQVTCKLLSAMLFSMMNWNTYDRIKMLGKIIHAKDMYLIAFDLNATEVYPKVFKDGEQPKSSRTPLYPESWKNQFGIPFYEHQQTMQINVLDGFAIYAIREKKSDAPITDIKQSGTIPAQGVDDEVGRD